MFRIRGFLKRKETVLEELRGKKLINCIHSKAGNAKNSQYTDLLKVYQSKMFQHSVPFNLVSQIFRKLPSPPYWYKETVFSAILLDNVSTSRGYLVRGLLIQHRIIATYWHSLIDLLSSIVHGSKVECFLFHEWD